MQSGPIIIDSLSAFIEKNYPILASQEPPTREATPEELAALKEYLTPPQRKNTPNSCGKLLRTPCHLAVIHNQPKILELFVLEAHGSLNNHDGSGNKPGDYATNEAMRRVVTALQTETLRRKEYEKTSRGGRDLGYLLERNKQTDDILIGMIRNFLLIRRTEVYGIYYAGSNLAHIAAWSHASEKVLQYLAIGCTDERERHFIDFNAQNNYGLRPIDYAAPSKRAYIQHLVEEQNKLLIKDIHTAAHKEMFQTTRANIVPSPQEEPADLTLISRMVSKLNLGPQTIASRSQKRPVGLVSMRLGAVSPRTELPQSAALAPISPSLSAELSIAASSSKEKAPLLASSDSSPPRVNSPQEAVSPRLKLAPLGERARKQVDKMDLSQAKDKQHEADFTSPRERGFSLLGTLKAAGTLLSPYSERSKPVALSPAESPASALSLPAHALSQNRHSVDANLPTYQIMDKDNLPAFKAKKRDPNGKSNSINHPYFLQAFISSAQNIFVWLVENGLYLDKENAWLKILEYTKEGPTSRRVAFLNRVIKELSPRVSVDQTNAARLALFSANEQFDHLLIENGLKNITQLPLKPEFKENSLEAFLYQLCCGFNFETKEYKFNPEAMQNAVYGCLAEFSLEEVLDTLTILNRFLHPNQKLFALYIVKTIVVFDNIYNCYQSESFCEKSLGDFLKLMAKSGFAGLNTKLIEILALRKKAATPVLTSINLLQAVIARCKVKKVPFTEEPLTLANELRAISLQFYQTVSLHEFVKLQFSKDNKAKLSPNVVKQIEITNKLSYYFIKTALEKSSDEERNRYLVLLINTLHELIHGQLKDFNSAMCIAGALGDRFMNKYMKQLIDFDKEAVEKWNTYSELFMPMNNFGKLRKAMTAGIPFLGTFLQDLTFTAEQQDIAVKCSTLANVFSSFSAFQEKLFNMNMLVTTDLLYTLESLNPRDDQVLEILDIKASAPPIRFDLDISLAKLIQMLQAFIDKNLPLSVKVRLEEQWTELTGENALTPLIKWLQENIELNNSETVIQISTVLTLLRKMPSLKEKIEDVIANFEAEHPVLITAKPQTPPLLLSPRQGPISHKGNGRFIAPSAKDLQDKGKSPKPL